VSIAVDLAALRAQIEDRSRAPYVLTVSPDGRPHAVAIITRWDGDSLILEPGNRTAANATDRPVVSLVWPPDASDGYSLIVDASVTAVDAPGDGHNRLVLAPTKAVLHRPATVPGPTDGCTADCIPLT
jgi:hypothetical protein